MPAMFTTIHAVMEAGGSVLYIDPEDTPRGIVTRFLMLGALSDVLRERLFYLHNPTPEEIREAQVWAIDRHPEMSILDGLAESMAAVDADENVAGDVIRYYRKYLRPFADAGSAVVIADHVTKNKEGRGQFARGSGAKAGRYDGASYEIVMGKSYAPGIEGFVKLKVQKDRSGGIGPRECIAAELHFVPNASGGSIVTFREPAAKQEGPFRPTAIMDKIVKHLEVVGEATASDLRSLGGKTEYIATAIGFLKKDGKIDTRKNGNKVLHFLLPEKQTA